MPWQIFDSGAATAFENMQKDSQLLETLGEAKDPILHLYEWQSDSATYGHFIKPEKFLSLQGVKKQGLELAKRPTGGGIIFHIADYAFSALVPSAYKSFSINTLENYALINNIVARVIERFLGGNVTAVLLAEHPQAQGQAQFFCMGKPTIYDVMLNGRKVGGAAQRRTKAGFLHQGSISIGLPPISYLQQVLLPETAVIEAMQQNSSILLNEAYSSKKLQAIRLELKELLIEEALKQP